MLRLVVLLAIIVLGLAPAEARQHRHSGAVGRPAMVELVVSAARRHGVPERLAYGVTVRGTERPKGWMPDLNDAPRGGALDAEED